MALYPLVILSEMSEANVIPLVILSEMSEANVIPLVILSEMSEANVVEGSHTHVETLDGQPKVSHQNDRSLCFPMLEFRQRSKHFFTTDRGAGPL